MSMNKLVMLKVADMSVKAKEETNIELANINDLALMIKDAEKSLAEVNKYWGEIDRLKPLAVNAGNKVVDSQNKMNGLAGTFEKQFSDIGLNFKDSKEFKQVSDFMSRSRVVVDMTAKLKNL